ncbi:hypothetical protein SAMN04488587_1516 [Methanococcoides vulcani]|uniref:SpoVT-AbrB domain-containing protein n=1 Tax=Methanococcoides vulcani TaxID=1353158 RepID=A0A1I0A9X6_9EURY|nr:hypothetical protein [Methanococcoides vulcani]SES90949.1 hypothetical protein SAMN04488587_1516 [Methanococcoides vulcani]
MTEKYIQKNENVITRKLYCRTGAGMRVQIPAVLATLAGLKGNEDVQLDLENGKIVITPVSDLLVKAMEIKC